MEKDLWNQKRENQITSKEWFKKLQVEAGNIPNRLSAWHKKTDDIVDPEDKGISIAFTNDFLRVADNGNVYRKMVLRNDTDEKLTIHRIDATIAGIKEFFFIDDKWISNRTNGQSYCGNSYFKQTLNPYSKIELELSNGGLLNGEIEVGYKIVFVYQNTIYESNVIKVKLFKNQVKRLKEKST